MYKTLLVPVDARSRSARSVELACRIASDFDAAVVGLFVKPDLRLPGAVYAESGGRLLQQAQQQAVVELAQAAQAIFEAGVKAAGLAKAEWRTAEGERADAVELQARYADLVIINQTDPDEPGSSHFADAVLLSLGRPALLVPYVGEFKSLGKRVLVGWNASREAARAVTDALPLLRRAEQVTVMAVDARASAAGHGEDPGADIARFLARHGVNAEVMQTASAGVDAGNLLLSRAYDLHADLIVMGAYGHTRIREIVLGGATRTVLESMTVPVLMSH
jgi:nucleotide-binding universal stress UspA family protein